MEYSKAEAIRISNDFIKEVNELEKKYGMKFNSDTGDVYLTFKTTEDDKYWDTISLGWNGDGTGIKVIEKPKSEKIREKALSKLTDEERRELGLS